MDRSRRISPAQCALALSMIALGCLGFIYGDVALVWQHLPVANLPGERLIAYAFATIELVGGLGLLAAASSRTAAMLLCVFLLLWVVLLKLPAIIVMPAMEATWLGVGEIAVMLAGAWVLLATHTTRPGVFTGARGVRAARVLFALSLPAIGLSHFFYGEQTAALVPAWLPWRLGWAYFTGAANLAACLGVLFGIWPRVAATLEAAMLAMITLMVWAPPILTTPTDRTAWTALVISAAIASGAWLVAESYDDPRWRTTGRYPAAATAL